MIVKLLKDLFELWMAFYEEIVAWLCSCVIDDGEKVRFGSKDVSFISPKPIILIMTQNLSQHSNWHTKLSITAACHDVTGDVNVMGRAIKLH